ncbi:MAG: sigma-54 dependent transcriptional regulator [Proteobacteria bacterium]|nr:sigma-54 dependent transcriptional regulator [Pseudomonadota bacterium]MBU1709248.1 sigma-54 dependent transcriptional regulator [Pseudomonadota bacterium]
MQKTKILFVDDEQSYRNSFVRSFVDDEYLIETASDGENAMQKLMHFHADTVITDIKMPRMDGFALLQKIKNKYPDIFVVMATAYGGSDEAIRAMKAGANDYVIKPFDSDIIRMILSRMAEKKRNFQALLFKGEDRRKKFRFQNIIGQDIKMLKVFQMIKDVAATNSTVLLTGESGTGKELVAEAIHFESKRKDKPFIKVNCSALTDTLINSELFGHEKGAFTGAVIQKKGHFELAHGGTIFLDEIGDISVHTQLSLLRVLELGTFHRVGGTKTIKVDTRVICATNKNLEQAVQEKLFREDLFYRINVVALQLPPLRERKSDIPLLAFHFLNKLIKSHDSTKTTGIAKDALDMLIAHDWPGNVRELANILENAIIFCKKNKITPEYLPPQLTTRNKIKEFSLTLNSKSLPHAESQLIRSVLETSNWNLKRAAEDLDIARGTLYSKMKKYKIIRP